MSKPKFADLADLPEDNRIQIIGEAAMQGKRVAFIVDDHAKAERYMVKLTGRFPELEVQNRLNTGIAKTVTVIVEKRKEVK